MSSGISFCANCHELASKNCSVCKYTYYCSERCQKEDWQNHKTGCKIQQQLNIINDAHKAQQEAKKPAGKPPRENCTGCGVKFTKVYPRDGDCQECGYQACESCVVHTSRGTCYCTNHNIGTPYCAMEPRWYHQNGRTGERYKGDRHPEDGYIPEVYETKERACNNCGKITKVFKKKYCDPAMFRSY